MSSPVRWFFEVNEKYYSLIAKIFPNTKADKSVYYKYDEFVKNNLAEGFTILDVGGGKGWQFQRERKRFRNLKVIVVDPSEDQLNHNHDADEKILFAMGEGRVPLDDNSVDLAMSHMVLEHIENIDEAVSEISRVLKPGGKFISAFPNKFALFAMINQMIPNWLARKILFSIYPKTKGGCGFKAYYHKTYYPAMQNLLKKYNFSSCEFSFDYSESGYFKFFLPFGLLALLWDFIMYIFNVKPLCGYLSFIATKKS